MKCTKLIIGLFFGLLFSLQLNAQDTSKVTLFEHKTDIAYKGVGKSYELSRTYITANREALKPGFLQEGDLISFHLNNEEQVFTIQRVSQYTEGTFSVIAKGLYDGEDYITLTIEDERFKGKLGFGKVGDIYFLDYDEVEKANYLAQIKTSELDIFECAVDHNHDDIDLLEHSSPGMDLNHLLDHTTYADMATPSEVNVMIVYTPNALRWMNERSSKNMVISEAMNLSQMVIDNSDIHVELNLVHTHQTNYTEIENEEGLELLRKFTAGPHFNPWESEYYGYMEEVHDVRDEYNADLVALFAEVNNRWGGYAWIRPIRPEFGFSVNRVQQMDFSYTLVHEWGHNFGSEHSRNQENAAARDIGYADYSTGWRWTGNDGNGYVSVMTYQDGDERVPYFSNPDIYYKGVPTGSYSGEFAPADNARSINETRHLISQYRSGTPFPPETPALLSPANLETDLPVNLTFTWEEVLRANQYQFQLSESSDFIQLTTNVHVAENSFSNEIELDYQTKYYWRVRGVNDGVQGNWSTTREFTTQIGVPEIVGLTSPINNSVGVPITTDFEWESIPTATEYTFQLSEEESFSTVTNETRVENNRVSFSIPLRFSANYYWRVRASNEIGDGEWSEHWNFETEIPWETLVESNFPNPFNNQTTIRYRLANHTRAVLEIYSISGRKIELLIDDEQPPGVYDVQFNAKNLASGVYLLRFQTDEVVEVQKLTLIK